MGRPVSANRPDFQGQAGRQPSRRHRIRKTSSKLRALRKGEEGEGGRAEAEVGHLRRQRAAEESSGHQAVETDSVGSRSYWSGAR